MANRIVGVARHRASRRLPVRPLCPRRRNGYSGERRTSTRPCCAVSAPYQARQGFPARPRDSSYPVATPGWRSARSLTLPVATAFLHCGNRCSVAEEAGGSRLQPQLGGCLKPRSCAKPDRRVELCAGRVCSAAVELDNFASRFPDGSRPPTNSIRSAQHPTVKQQIRKPGDSGRVDATAGRHLSCYRSIQTLNAS